MINKILDKLSKWILCNYFLLLIITQLVRIFGYETKFEVLILLASIFILFNHINEVTSKLSNSAINIFLLFIVFYIICTALFNDYILDLKYYSFRYFVWAIFFFYIGQMKIFANDEIYSKQKNVLLILYAISLYLYFIPPSWYVVWKNSAFSSIENYTIDITSYSDDFSRLSGFWSYPYFVCYSAYIYITYYLLRCRLGLENSKIYLPILIAFSAMFLGMMRVSIICCIIFYLTLIFFFRDDPKYRNKTWKHLNYSIILFLFIAVFYSSFYLTDYISQRIFNNTNVVSERIMMFSTLFDNISVFGQGIGRFSNEAKLYGYPSIMDSEWIKLLCEIGIVGVSLIVIFFIRIIKMGLSNYKNNFFELSVIIFFLISMIGSNSLEQPIVKHSVFLWFCAGQILNKYRKNYVK